MYAMTPEKRRAFHLRGCVPRSLLHLCALKGRPITDEAFCDGFEVYFGGQPEEYGILDFNRFTELCGKLKLPLNNTFEKSYESVHAAFNQQGYHVLVWTMKDIRPGHRHEHLKHCSVLTKIDHNNFSVWTPTQDGKAQTYDDLPTADWTTLECTGWVFY